jgi:hypothetical protein
MMLYYKFVLALANVIIYDYRCDATICSVTYGHLIQATDP